MTTNPFENGQVRHHAASVEVLESTEDDVVAVVGDLLVVIPRIHRTTDEEVVLNNQLLRPLLLFVRPDDIGRPAPEQMVAEEHADGAVRFGDFTDDSVRYVPALSATAVLLGAEDFGETGRFEEGDFGLGALVLLFAVGRVFREDGGHVSRTLEPLVRFGWQWRLSEVLMVDIVYSRVGRWVQKW